MRTLLGMLVLGLGGCSLESALDAGRDAGTPIDAGVDSGSPSDSGVPAEIPSHQVVRFDLHNDGGLVHSDGGQLVYVVDSSNRLCDPVPIERRTAGMWQPIPMRIGIETVCGGYTEIFAYDLYWTAISPDAPLTLSWDARELALYGVSCPDNPRVTSLDLRGALQPSPPGEYRATFCFQATGLGGGGAFPYGLNKPCVCGLRTVVPFTLPADGDVLVDVPTPLLP